MSGACSLYLSLSLSTRLADGAASRSASGHSVHGPRHVGWRAHAGASERGGKTMPGRGSERVGSWWWPAVGGYGGLEGVGAGSRDGDSAALGAHPSAARRPLGSARLLRREPTVQAYRTGEHLGSVAACPTPYTHHHHHLSI
jgi:hypothetical protein